MVKRIISYTAAAAMAVSMLTPVTAADNDTSLVLAADFEKDNALIDLINGAEITDGGKNGSKGLHLDGIDDFAQLPTGIISDEMTVSAWVKQDKKNVWGRLFDFGADSGNNFFFAPSSGGASRVEAKAPSGADTMDAPEFESTGRWAYYTVTKDENGFKLYRDGRLISEKASVGIKLTDIKDELNYIGKSHYEGDAYFAGTIDDLKIYSRALTHEEIMADMFINTSYDEDVTELLNVYTPDIEDGEVIFADNLNLPDSYIAAGDITIQYTSSDPSVIDPRSGKVTPAAENTEVTVTVGARHSYSSSTEFEVKKEFTVIVPSADKAPFTVNIDASDRSRSINDNMWGLFFEDINSAADGGLYAELVQNGSFEYPDNMYSWTAEGEVGIRTDNPMNENNPSYAEMSAGSAVANDGYMGMSVKKGQKYNVSLFAYASSAPRDLLVQLINDQGIIGEATLSASEGGSWQKLEYTIEASADAENAKIKITNKSENSVGVDFISLMPLDTYKGHGLRRDLCEAIEAIHPKFLRFPGGCAVEGNTMALAYNWKDTVGGVYERKMMENIWNTGSEPYIMSYGLGFYEYFQLCEDMGMEPIPILNCGMACQVRSGSSQEEAYLVPMDKLQPYIQDALDLIEFANGTDMSNKWAKLRADMGHPEPFGLKYIGIGNEQWGEDYFDRYEAFAKAIRAAYPSVELVTTSGPASSGDGNDLAWSWVKENQQYADVLDEHYYENPDWFLRNAHRYAGYDRSGTKVFLGEYASKGNTWYNALAEAAYMTGLERNADVVRMASYAPMFAKYGNTQWTAANMIWFNNSDFVLTPDYYVQKLFGTNSGDYSINTDVSLDGTNEEKFSGGIALGAWNSKVEYKDLKLTDAEGNPIAVPDFAGWENGGGEWTVKDDGSVSQTDVAERCILYLDGDYSDFTMTVKAKKTEGLEGYQVGFAGKDFKNYYRVNIGGWSNTKTKLQKINDGIAELVSNVAEGNHNSDVTVKENEWQEIKVEVSGNSVKAYLDGEEACVYTKPESEGPVYASSVYDAANEEVVVKLVNTADGEVKVNVKLANVGRIVPSAKVITMSAGADAVNTLENKDNIVPKEGNINNAGESFEYAAAARSVNIIRLKAENLIKVGSGDYEYYDYSGNKHTIKLQYDENGVLADVKGA